MARLKLRETKLPTSTRGTYDFVMFFVNGIAPKNIISTAENNSIPISSPLYLFNENCLASIILVTTLPKEDLCLSSD